jgi:hypothetical protein
MLHFFLPPPDTFLLHSPVSDCPLTCLYN